MLKKKKPVVFIDKDGVINFDSKDYIKCWKEVNFIPKSIEAIKLLTEKGFISVIITNQSMINRGLSRQEDLNEILNNMKDTIKSNNGKISGIFFCPHTPDENCNCRKPSPGLIFQAKNALDIDISLSCMIGDSTKDIECGKNAGCKYTILVKTGNGKSAEKQLIKKKIHPDHVANDLYTAAEWIISKYGRVFINEHNT